jgi:GT2 family glycosyltransferase
VRKSDYPNYRILLVDNASSDDTVSTVKQQFPDVEVVENTSNLGYAEGNNRGIRYAMQKGADFLLILNNDTVIDRLAVTILVNATRQNDSSFICAPAVYKHSSPDELAFGRKVWDTAALRFRTVENYRTEFSLQTAETLPTAFASGCSLFFGRPIVEKVGLFDPRFFLMWEDTDWCTRAARKGCQIFIVPAAKIWHKESRSFEEGSPETAYHYYYFRNRLLWIQNNLNGRDRRRAKLRAWRELLKPLHRRYGPELGEQRYLIFRARLLAGWHYIIRRFGPL